MMKRLFIVSAFALALVLGGCKDKNTAEETPAGMLTLEQQKTYLRQAGKQLREAFHTPEQESAAEFAEAFWSEYDGTHTNVYALPKRLAALAQGDGMPVCEEKSLFPLGEGEVFDLSFLDSGGETCVLHATHTSFVLMQGQKELFGYEVVYSETEMIIDTVRFRVANRIGQLCVHVNDSAAAATYKLTDGGTALIDASVNLMGYGLCSLSDCINVRTGVTNGIIFANEYAEWCKNNGEQALTLQQAQYKALILNKYVYAGIFFPQTGGTEQLQLKQLATEQSGGAYDAETVLFFTKDQTSTRVLNYFEYNYYEKVFSLTEYLAQAYIRFRTSAAKS